MYYLAWSSLKSPFYFPFSLNVLREYSPVLTSRNDMTWLHQKREELLVTLHPLFKMILSLLYPAEKPQNCYFTSYQPWMEVYLYSYCIINQFWYYHWDTYRRYKNKGRGVRAACQLDILQNNSINNAVDETKIFRFKNYI